MVERTNMMNNSVHNRHPAFQIERIPNLVLLVVLLLMVITQSIPVSGQEIDPPATVARTRQGERTADHNADVAMAWFDLSLDLVTETTGFTPPVASRAFGYLGVTLYETVRPGMPGFHSLAGQLNELPQLPRSRGWARYHWPSAANAALASMMRMLFPTATEENLRGIDTLEEAFSGRYKAELDFHPQQRPRLPSSITGNALYGPYSL
jgi:hypothetical protein